MLLPLMLEGKFTRSKYLRIRFTGDYVHKSEIYMTSRILKTMLDLGALVNAQDENGETVQFDIF
jgi:hypothetical protein